MRHSALMLILVLFIGCSGIPCSPPEYFAPEEGAPYVAEEVNVSTQAGHVLAGTLTIPKDINQPLPGVILITGSEPVNRDFTHTWPCTTSRRGSFPTGLAYSSWRVITGPRPQATRKR